MVENIKRGFSKIGGYLLAGIIIVVGIVLLAMGFKEIRLGGLLGTLVGKKDAKKPLEVINTIPESRVDKDGKLIPLNAADSKGIKQAEVIPIEEPSIFSDPRTIQVTTGGKEKIDIALPDGVTAKDIDKVIVLNAQDYAVVVKSTSKVQKTDIDDLLKKYENLLLSVSVSNPFKHCLGLY